MFSVILGGIWASFRFSRKNKLDVVLALWAIPSGIWAIILKWLHGIPYVVWCLGSDIWDYGSKSGSRDAIRIILRQASVLFADGFQLGEDVQALSGKRCLFLPSSRRMDIHISAKTDIMPARKNYLFIGRYHPNKGPDILIEAIAKLDPLLRKQVHFHFFGGGPLEKTLKQKIQQEGLSDIITLKGYIEEKEAVAYLKACDALIIPSRVESIPVVLSDALQTGCPVLVSDVGDMGRLIKEYGAGIVFPSNSPTQLAEAIEKGVSKVENFGEGRTKLLDVFDLSRSVERFVEITLRNISR
jgi:glycosyltransferase involved in cell wall biosynthesis